MGNSVTVAVKLLFLAVRNKILKEYLLFEGISCAIMMLICYSLINNIQLFLLENVVITETAEVWGDKSLTSLVKFVWKLLVMTYSC